MMYAALYSAGIWYIYIEEGQRRMIILLFYIFTHRVIKMSPVINNPADL